MSTIGKRIKELRRCKKVTQKEIAERIGVNPVSVQRFEYGSVRPSLDPLVALADFFQVPIDFLLGRGIFKSWEQIRENKAFVIDCMAKWIVQHLRGTFNSDIADIDESTVVAILSDELSLINWLPVLVDEVIFTDKRAIILFKLDCLF